MRIASKKLKSRQGAWPGHGIRWPLRASPLGRDDPGGGDGGVETAGQATASEALHFRSSGDVDSCLGTPQERYRRQKTCDSPQADKACKRGGVASSGGRGRRARNSRETAKQAAGKTRAATTCARLPTTPEVHTDPWETPQRGEVPPTAGRRAQPARETGPNLLETERSGVCGRKTQLEAEVRLLLPYRRTIKPLHWYTITNPPPHPPLQNS
ncbi:hypothetical protein NDU88_001729 [Pleurodeles waltl]|uniref:Uncharacterized protein n=1 Tax=Pleurodeles waltl TaxID=8319 RepID=A0AAV7U814_PLEWA|nr:hypothetical protein NDU88_001729 [Pleurodeles waltl]